MKRWFRWTALFAVLILALTACGKGKTASVKDTEESEEETLNLLEVTFDGKTYDLSQPAAEFALQVSNNGKWLVDPVFNMFIGGDSKRSKISLDLIQKITENQMITMFVESLPGGLDLPVSVPKEGVQTEIVGFGGIRKEPELTVFQTAEGYGKDTAPADLTGYYDLGSYGYNSYYMDEARLCFAVDGQPIPLDSYLDALPDTLDQGLRQKMAVLGNYTTLANEGAGTAEDLDLKSAPVPMKVACAAALAGQDAINRLNTGEIKNFACIELGFKDGKLKCASYFIYKEDSFSFH